MMGWPNLVLGPVDAQLVDHGPPMGVGRGGGAEPPLVASHTLQSRRI